MSYYVCLGKFDFYSTHKSKPQYSLGGLKFNEIFNFFQGYAKTPQELNLTYPYPDRYQDKKGNIWALKEGIIPDNHQFKREKEINWNNQTYYKARNKEKYQNPNPKWNSVDSETPGLWRQLKNKGLIK